MKNILIKLVSIIVLVTLISVNSNVCAQSYVRDGNTFVSVKQDKSKPAPIKTKFTWKEPNDSIYPIYLSTTGSCFIIKQSKRTGREYRKYLGEQLSRNICRELEYEYKKVKNN